MFNFIPVIMEAAANGAAGNPLASSFGTIIMIVAMIAIFYFLLYRPQKKQEKETARMRNSLEVGDEITTIGGIIGAVVSIKEDTVTIETGKDRCKIRIHRSAVRSIDIKANEEYEETK